MPPNRSSLIEISDALSSLDVNSFLNTKEVAAFPPLTAEQEEPKEEQVEEEEEYIFNPNATASYWDWPEETEETKKDAFIESILVEEDIRQTLSVAHIVENLVAASQKEETAYVSTEVNTDDYWNMPAESDESSEEVIVAQHVLDASHPKASYWDWPTETAETKKAALITKIIKDEEARRVTSCVHLDEKLASFGATTTTPPSAESAKYWNWESHVVAPHVGDETHPRNSYWNWDSSSSTDSKQAVINKILQEERIRQVLSAEHVQQNELQRHVVASAPMVSTGIDSSSYGSGKRSKMLTK